VGLGAVGAGGDESPGGYVKSSRSLGMVVAVAVGIGLLILLGPATQDQRGHGGVALAAGSDPATVVYFPVVSGTAGSAGSLWHTDLRILNPSSQDATATVELYPANTTGLAGPSATVQVAVAAGGQGTFDQALETLFGASGNGAIRIVSPTPIEAAARIYDDQRMNPGVRGTLGQYVPGQGIDSASTVGALPLLSNRPASDHMGFRTNLGYFNPWAEGVAVTFTAWTPDGAALGSTTVTLAPYANKVENVFKVIGDVGGSGQSSVDFFVTFSAARPLFVFASVVDNMTNSPINIMPLHWGGMVMPPVGTRTPRPTMTMTPPPTTTMTPMPTMTMTPMPTMTMSPMPTMTMTPMPTMTMTPMPTMTMSPMPTMTMSPMPTMTMTPMPTMTMSPMPTMTMTPMPTMTMSPMPTMTMSPMPTRTIHGMAG
jgi:hypothetical protein